MTPKEAVMKSESGGIVEFEDDAERILQRLWHAGFEVVARPALIKRPVAFRVRVDPDHWFITENEALACKLSEYLGAQMQGLYVRDGT